MISIFKAEICRGSGLIGVESWCQPTGSARYARRSARSDRGVPGNRASQCATGCHRAARRSAGSIVAESLSHVVCISRENLACW